jgi:hypothetical protein
VHVAGTGAGDARDDAQAPAGREAAGRGFVALVFEAEKLPARPHGLVRTYAICANIA